MELETRQANYHFVEYEIRGKDSGADAKKCGELWCSWETAQRFAQSQSKAHKSMVTATEPNNPFRTYLCYVKGKRLY